jgi:hypothetical protein
MSSYQFARIDLSKTNYSIDIEWMYITRPNISALNAIYRDYCVYKKFSSVMPIFDARHLDPATDVIGYYDQARLVAFSLIKRYDEHNALCDQFAWTYHNPKLRMGIETMKTECAIYKARGFRYLYLEQAHLYKSEIEGFEILGPLE